MSVAKTKQTELYMRERIREELQKIVEDDHRGIYANSSNMSDKIDVNVTKNVLGSIMREMDCLEVRSTGRKGTVFKIKKEKL